MNRYFVRLFSIGFIVSVFILSFNFLQEPNSMEMKSNTRQEPINFLDTATLGAGCFWCVEAIYQDLKGVESVISGYSGGAISNPDYREISSGMTGHAEVCQIMFDPKVIAFDQILEVFWEVHDPTTLNRQGADVGTQYRSVIFYHNEEQKKLAESSKGKMTSYFKDPIVTEITAYKDFFKAEDYHQDYFSNNPSQPYCSVVIGPKVKKFRKKYGDMIK